MNGKLNFWKNEEGVSALETAIILIAFVVVAAIFAFTILSAGTASTEESKEAILAGMEEVRSSMELRGSVVAQKNGASDVIDYVTFSVNNAAGGNAIDLTAPVSNTLIIDYRDASQVKTNVTWTLTWVVQNDSDQLLETGEVAEIKVDLTGLTTKLAPNTQFTLEVKPPKGGIITLERTTPAYFDTIMDLK